MELGRTRVTSFMTDWSWNPRWDPTSVGLGLQLVLVVLAGLLNLYTFLQVPHDPLLCS